MYEQKNPENLVDANGQELEVGQTISASNIHGTGDDLGFVIGFTSTDLDHYPTVAVDFGGYIEEFSGHQVHQDSPAFVDEVIISIPRASRKES